MKKLILIMLFFGHLGFSQTSVLAHLERTVQNNTASSSALFILGQYYFFNGKFVEANQQLEKAIELNGEQANFYVFQAASYEAQDMNEQALNSYDKAITAESSAEYLIQRGYLRYKLKKYVGASADFSKALEKYEIMTDIRKMQQDCEKNGGTADKVVENNNITTKIPISTPTVFVENFIKHFERFGDAGELYRAMSYLFTNNLDKAVATFEPLSNKTQNAKSLYLSGLANELKNNNTEAINYYLKATQKANDGITTALFEKFVGFPNAEHNLKHLRNSSIDYQFSAKNIATKIGYMPELVKENNNLIKGSLRTATNSYNFVIEKQKSNNYQLVIRDTTNNKIMFSTVKTERKGKVFTVKIIWGEKKDESGVAWVVRPQDIFTARYAPSVNANYSQEGQRTQAAKNTTINWETLSAIRPEVISMNEALNYATRAFMVGYLIK